MFWRYLTGDGNFVLNHKFKADLEIVASLLDGCGYFVENAKTVKHLEIAKDTPDVRFVCPTTIPPLTVQCRKRHVSNTAP